MDHKQRLFVDMDGTLAVFQPVDELEALYEKGYFEKLAPHQNVVDAIRELSINCPEIEVFILSSVLADSRYALEEKNRWLDRLLPEVDKAHRIFPPCGADKKDFVPGGIRESDCLLDDYTKNLTLWQPPAKGIKLLNGINATKGSWSHDRIRYDKPVPELVKSILSSMGGARVLDARPQDEGKEKSPSQSTIRFPTILSLKNAVENQKNSMMHSPTLVKDHIHHLISLGCDNSDAVISATLQKPHAIFLNAQRTWKNQGYQVKPEEKANGATILKFAKEQFFLRDGQSIPISAATTKERDNIISGKLQIQESTRIFSGVSYDITQTSCPPAAYPRFVKGPFYDLSPVERYSILKQTAQDVGAMVNEGIPQTASIPNYYKTDDSVIFISQNQNAQQKLTALCEALAQHIVKKTSTLQSPLERQLETTVLSLKLKCMLDTQSLTDSQLQRAATEFLAIPNRSLKMLDHTMTRTTKAAKLTQAQMNKTIEELSASPKQSRGAQKEISTNFLEQLE